MLSDEKVSELWYANAPLGNFAFKFARAIEAAVLAELAETKPVGVFDVYGDSYIQIKPEHADETSVKLYLHPAPAPEGMVMVPREPTQAMLDAGYNAGMYSKPACARAYEFMIAAAEKETRK